MTWHFPDPLDKGYLVCPCAECAKLPGKVSATDRHGTRADVCLACAKLSPSERNYAPERRPVTQAHTPDNKTAEIVVDYENNGEAWWDHARRVARTVRHPDFTRLFNALDASPHEKLEVSQGDAEQFLEVASKLDGWDDGPSYARNPVLVLW